MSAVVGADLEAYAAAHTTPPGTLLDELERETHARTTAPGGIFSEKGLWTHLPVASNVSP